VNVQQRYNLGIQPTARDWCAAATDAER
jgi:hypothetical protein